jgi:hypothetical protein
MTARRSPLYFRTVGAQENHVQVPYSSEAV